MRFQETLGISHQIRMLNLEIESVLNQELAKLGLSYAQYAALSVLEQHPGLSNAELARECFVSPQTMNRMAASLEQTGLIRKNERAKEALRIDLSLTARAEKLICDAHVLVNSVERKMVHGAKKGEVEEIKALLSRLQENLAHPSPASARR